jgi:DNA polymerase III delta subunit
MEIVLLYGPGLVAKRNHLVKIKSNFSADNVIVVDVKSEGLDKVSQLIQSMPLFATSSRLIVVENIPDNTDLALLSQGEDSLTVLIVADSPRADSKLLSSAKKMKIKLIQFEAEKEVTAFPFVDSLLEGKKTAFVELEKLLKEYGGMYTLSMIYYGLRRNLLPAPPSSFMRQKVESQKRRFKESDWQRLYRLTLETESDIKSGKTDEKQGLFRLTQQFIAN